MNIILTIELMRKIFPRMSIEQAQIFVDKQAVMNEITASAQRLAVCFANVQVETAGFDNRIVKNLTESKAYTAANVVKNWPNRYGSIAAVQQRFGTGPGWQDKMFDEIYGNRMGNRPNTNDGSHFIGRGAPQITGRDGYATIGRMIGVDLVNNPERCADPQLQPDIIAAYWKWKKLSGPADAGDLVEVRRRWNGGKIGLKVVEASYPKFHRIIEGYEPATAAVNVQPATSNVDETLRGYQTDLKKLGYFEIGDEDGRFGGRTQGAIKAFFIDRGIIDVSSNYPACASLLNKTMNEAFSEGWHRPVAPARAFATADDIKANVESVQPTQRAGLFAKIGAWFTGVTATGKAAFLLAPDLNDQSYSYIGYIKAFWNDIPDWVFPAAIFVIAIIIVRQTTKAKTATVDAYQQGKIN